MASLNRGSVLLKTPPSAEAPLRPQGAPKPVALDNEQVLRISDADNERVLRLLRANPQGLSAEEVHLRLQRHGANEVGHEARAGWLRQLWGLAISPFNLLLAALAVVNYLTDNPVGAWVVTAMVVVSVLLSLVQERRSSRAAERLQAMVSTQVTVLRRDDMLFSDGDRRRVITRSEKREIPLRELVPGDLLQLSAGDMIPADLRLLQTKDLFVSQSALTGESLPVEKSAAAGGQGGPLERANLCFMGSNVLSGTAQAVVMRTGAGTHFGALASSVTAGHETTAFEQGVQRYTRLMFTFMAVMVPAVLLINGFAKGNWFEALLFAVAVAVGLTPEMLPMIVTVNLAKGALSMSRQKVIVKRLNAIQNFGAMDVLCTDKTGTLTQDKVVLLRYVDPNGFKSARVLELGHLNSAHQTGLKNLLDLAVLDQPELATALKEQGPWRKVDEIPFDFQRRRMSVVVENGARPGHLLICKGALEEVFRCCDRAEVDGSVVALDEELRRTYAAVAQSMNEDGLRVIAVASRRCEPSHGPYSVADEQGLVLAGYLAFLDPPKESAAEAIRQLREHGVAVKVLTGDSDAVTRHVCKEVGIPVEQLLLGSDLDGMDDAALDAVVDERAVFCKLAPAQKERVIRSLHRRGRVVGFMGDGINDAPALKAADVGISVDNAVDIAKESADIILLEKSLLVLEHGVQEGRKVFGNIIKYIKMGSSSSFGNMFSLLGASFLLPFLPMLPTQILAQNLLYDLSQTAIPFDTMDPEYLAKPRRWEISSIGRFMLYIGPISSLFDYATFALMWWGFGCWLPGKEGVFQAGWFVEGLLSQTLIVHIIRTARTPFVESRATWPLLASTALVMAVGVAIPLSPVGAFLGFSPLPASYFPALVAILLAYAVLTHLAKTWFIRRYGMD